MPHAAASARLHVERAAARPRLSSRSRQISRKSLQPVITRDVSGEASAALLDHGGQPSPRVPSQGGRKHPQQEFLQVYTTNIPSSAAGPFSGLDNIISARGRSSVDRLAAQVLAPEIAAR